jgi:LacI family transcriptional regulator
MTERPRRRAVTLRDIAHAAGVAPSTVSRSLSGHRRISAETVARVRAVSSELGYVPNAAARSLRRRATKVLGLLLPDFADPVHGLVAAGFEAEAARRGFAVVFAAGDGDPSRERQALRVFREQRTDGVATVSGLLDPAEAADLFPPDHLVSVQADDPGLADTGDAPSGAIRTDDAAGMRAIVRHLVGSGYRSFAYVSIGRTCANLIRQGAVEVALGEAGWAGALRIVRTDLDAWRRPGGIVAELVRDLPEAIVCFDDKLALSVLDELRRAGVEAPADCAVTGFDDIPFAALARPRLTTIRTNAAELGRGAAEMLDTAIVTGAMPPSRRLPVELAIRDSTPPRPRTDEDAVAVRPPSGLEALVRG